MSSEYAHQLNHAARERSLFREREQWHLSQQAQQSRTGFFAHTRGIMRILRQHSITRFNQIKAQHRKSQVIIRTDVCRAE